MIARTSDTYWPPIWTAGPSSGTSSQRAAGNPKSQDIRELAASPGAAEETSVDSGQQAQPTRPNARNDGGKALSEDERRQVEELKKRDREVRAHEQAHLAAAGGYAMGGARYTYKMGPDGKRYAVGGEVPIDVSEVPGNPQATLQKAMTVRRAALAPSNPSSADRAIAAKAAMMAAQARQEMARDSQSPPSSGGQAPAAGPEKGSLSPQNTPVTESAPESTSNYRVSSGIQQYVRSASMETEGMVELFA